MKWMRITGIFTILLIAMLAGTGCHSRKPVSLLLNTNKGDMKIELYPWLAPKNTRNIIKLVEDGFYNEKRFHRVVHGQVIQTGAYARGSRTMDMLDYEIPDEINPKDLALSDELIQQYEKEGYIFNNKVRSMPLRYGVVAMANRGPNTNQSQFFIVTNPNGLQYLNGRYTAIGQIIDGVETMKAIDSVETDKTDEPKEEIYIIQAWVEK